MHSQEKQGNFLRLFTPCQLENKESNVLEIKFEQPFSLHMVVVETDDHVPSMRVETTIIITQFQHTFTYQGTFWIECTGWSNFASELDDSLQSAVLKDMSDYFTLMVNENEGKKVLSWEFKKTDVSGARKAVGVFSAEIDDDMLGKIRREFTEFPAWW